MANVPEIQLRDELQKFTGFNYTESVRALANDAVKSINRKEVPFPIYTCESPVIRSINTVLTNPKLAKSSVTIIPLLLDCIASDLTYLIDFLRWIPNEVVIIFFRMDFASDIRTLRIHKFTPRVSAICINYD